MRLYKLVAEQGLTNAEYNLGFAHKNGKGVERDIAEAARWFARAATKGHGDATAALARCSGREFI